MADNETAKVTTWGALVEWIRKDILEMTRPQFGKLAGVSEVSVYKWETGRIESVSGSTAATLADALAENGVDWITLRDLIEPDVDALKLKSVKADEARVIRQAAEAVDRDATAAEKLSQFMQAVGKRGASRLEMIEALSEHPPSTVDRRRRELNRDEVILEVGPDLYVHREYDGRLSR